ncbi:Zinc finger MYND domain-containing protein 12 [Physocladia obscura]|uniref:Zinc finger MYND domain-containing protein 12 n=1 Tax=Physocladia obscura TaxID=109957 RepID=A0AAD5XBZ4_9FUNG|nr:Zinc finger MYND domain-containing protein 12 [Physocladia obscura]
MSVSFALPPANSKGQKYSLGPQKEQQQVKQASRTNLASDDATLILNSTFINPLANPKDIYNVKIAVLPFTGISIQLDAKKDFQHFPCFFSDKEHQSTDYRGIHNKICSLLIPLRTPVTILGSEEERIHREKQTRHRQTQLLELSKTEAHKKLFEGQYDLAIPAALQALRFSMDVFGQDSIELVPSYLLLGEASIGLKQYTAAEDYLSLAKWAVLKAVNCENKIRSQMHRNFGLLYASRGEYSDALSQLALDKGPENILVLGGFFQLGNVFHKQGRLEQVTTVFDKVVSIWKQALKANEETLDEAQQAEAVQMLTTIFSFRTNFVTSPTGPAEVNFVLAQLHHIYGHSERARDYTAKALEVYEAALGREHTLTIEVRNFFKIVMGLQAAKTVTEKISRRDSGGHGSERTRRKSSASRR